MSDSGSNPRTGIGKTKKQAEQAAAVRALENLKAEIISDE